MTSSPSPPVARRRPRLGRFLGPLAIALVAVLPVVVIAAAPAAEASPQMTVTGSSFAGLAFQEWVGQASTLYGLAVNWQVSSSVMGLNDYAQNQVDFGASDIPYSSRQATSTPTSPYQYLPDVAGALAFMYNLTGKDGRRISSMVLNGQAVEDIFTGRIEFWDDPVITNINPQLRGDIPHLKIEFTYRTDASGENYLLSDYFLHLDPNGFTKYQEDMKAAPFRVPSASWPVPDTSNPGFHLPPGYPGWAAGDSVGATGSDNAADDVSAAASDGAITYVETAYAIQHNMPVASLVNASGHAVQPTSVNDAVALERAILFSDLTQNLAGVYSNPLPSAYPISAYSYMVTPCTPALAARQHTTCTGPGSSSPFSPAKGQALGQFVQFVGCAGQEKMATLGYSPLPPNLVQDDFNAVGRMNGGVEPPPVNAQNCKNPYVDGEIPLPGEPQVVNLANPGVQAAVLNGASGASTTTVAGGAGSAAAASGAAAGKAGAAKNFGGSASNVHGGNNALRFSRLDHLNGGFASALTHFSALLPMLLWCLVLAVLILGPIAVASIYGRRRSSGTDGTPDAEGPGPGGAGAAAVPDDEEVPVP